MSSVPIRVNSLRGRITTGLYAKESKSEHEAIFIETADGRYVLRSKTGPVFNDPKLRQYVGHEVECDGFLVGTTLLGERIKVVD
jgi:hypothetical protein